MSTMKKSDVVKLAELAHIKVSPEETEKLLGDLDSILSYVSEISELSGTDMPEKRAGVQRNVMREDDNPHDSGIHTEALLKEAPEREGDYVKVKKIL